MGIERSGTRQGFASLRATRITDGLADLELGPVRLANVPVTVHEDGLQADPVATAFGATIDAIIGTNVLAQFLPTLDAPGKRLLLAPRGTPSAGGTEVPFALWTDHFMFARGSIGTRPATFFVDSGLVALDADGVQASLLAPNNRVRQWATTDRNTDLVPIAGDVGLGSLTRNDARAFAVPARTWRRLAAAWPGIHADALLGYGFLKHYAWTLDFDRHTYRFSPPAPASRTPQPGCGSPR